MQMPMAMPATLKICDCEFSCDSGCRIERLYSTLDDQDRMKELIKVQFMDTPLHEAAEAGTTDLAVEIMNLMPFLATKLNPRGLSPLHAAIANGRGDTALALAKLDRKLVLVKGKGGLTPLHYAAAAVGQVELLAGLLKACPEAMGVLSNRRQTAVHVALENRNAEAAHLLVNWEVSVARESRLAAKDAHGNTILHVAARYCYNKEVLKLMVKLVKVNKRNNYGKTPLNIAIQHKNVEAMEMLKSEGATTRGEEEEEDIPGKKPSKTVGYLLQCHADKYAETLTRVYFFTIKELTLELRNTILVVAALIATATYQGALQPPGGVYSAEGSAISRQGSEVHPPGRMVMGTTKYSYFMPTNTLAFIASTVIIIFVLPDRAFIMILQACLIFMCVGYLLALNFISYDNNFSRILHVSCSCALALAFSLKLAHYCFKSYFDKEAWVFRRLGVKLSNRRAPFPEKKDGHSDSHDDMSVLRRMRQQYKLISKRFA